MAQAKPHGDPRSHAGDQLVLAWGPGRPLPIRPVRALAKPRYGSAAPPWHVSGPPDHPFDFSGRVAALCADIAARCPALAHVEVARILFGFTQARTRTRLGLQARLTPLRFPGGALRRRRGGTMFQVQRVIVGGQEMAYLLTFCLPRFLDQEFEEKLVTVFHELYHISPTCDGDLRRHGGRYHVHSRSQREYDLQMAALARQYLASRPDPDLHAFLRLNFDQLRARHGAVVGALVPRPKLIPVGG